MQSKMVYTLGGKHSSCKAVGNGFTDTQEREGGHYHKVTMMFGKKNNIL